MSAGGINRGKEKSLSRAGKTDDRDFVGRRSCLYSFFDFFLQGVECASRHYGNAVHSSVGFVRGLAVHHRRAAAQKELLDGNGFFQHLPVPDHLPDPEVPLPACGLKSNLTRLF